MGKSRATGVGKGHGPGSVAGQFKKGHPSGNPCGRPRKVKLPPANDLGEAIVRELAKVITISDNGISRKVTQAEALAAATLSQFPKMKVSEQLQLLRYLTTIEEKTPKLPDPPEDRALADERRHRFIQQLSDSCRAHGLFEAEGLGPSWTGPQPKG